MQKIRQIYDYFDRICVQLTAPKGSATGTSAP